MFVPIIDPILCACAVLFIIPIVSFLIHKNKEGKISKIEKKFKEKEIDKIVVNKIKSQISQIYNTIS